MATVILNLSRFKLCGQSQNVHTILGLFLRWTGYLFSDRIKQNFIRDMSVFAQIPKLCPRFLTRFLANMEPIKRDYDRQNRQMSPIQACATSAFLYPQGSGADLITGFSLILYRNWFLFLLNWQKILLKILPKILPKVNFGKHACINCYEMLPSYTPWECLVHKVLLMQMPPWKFPLVDGQNYICHSASSQGSRRELLPIDSVLFSQMLWIPRRLWNFIWC